MPRHVIALRQTGAVVLAMLIAAPPPAGAQNEATQRAKVTRYVDTWLREAGMPAAKRNIQIKLVDLNDDRRPEALVIVNGLDTCGARGCTAFALDLRGAEARGIGYFTAQTLEPLSTSTHGWRDLSLNGFRVIFQDGQYKSTGRR